MSPAPDALATARDLVAISSVNPMGAEPSASHPGERQLVEYVAAVLQRHRIDFQRFESDPRRPSLVASVDVGSDEVLLLEAHADTVPAEGMTIAPFDPEVRDGALYGRGSCDTKGAMAAFLCGLLRAAETGSLRTSVLLAITADEESTQIGARAVLREGIRATAAVVGEPTSLAIVRAHKGVCQFRLRTRGTAAHASNPSAGDNAILTMTRALVMVEEYARGLAARPDPDLGPPTLNVGTIAGGSGANSVPDRCVVQVDRRLVAGETAQGCVEELRGFLAALGDAAPEVEPAYLEMPPLATLAGSGVVRRLGRILDSMALSSAPVIAEFGTDAALYGRAGIPSVVFGPGSIAHAHTATERCPTEEIAKASEAILRLVSDAR